MTTIERPKRLSSNHRLVYEVVRGQKSGDHLAAAEIFARARALKPSIGHSTVYRALDRLCALKLVQALHVPGLSGALYETAGADHSHFVCRRCGRVDDIGCDLPMAEIDAIVGRAHGKVETIALTVHGLCSVCWPEGSILAPLRTTADSISDGSSS